MASEENQKAGLEPDADSSPLRMAKGQISYSGLNVVSGQILEECNQDLIWPQCISTYKMMFKDATIAPALNMVEMAIAKAEWTVKIPEGYEEELEAKAKFLKSVMDDMEHTWVDFIRQSSTFSRFGFAPVEKVYRKRLKNQGSRHNDGLYGLRCMPLIAQDSVESWMFDQSGRKVTGLKQYINKPRGREQSPEVVTNTTVDIPRSKFMLFRADPIKDNPIGNSPLNSIYVAWKYKTELEKHQAVSVSQDLRGLKVIKIPARYLSEDASDEEKQTRQHFERILRLLHNGEQSGVLIPQVFDENGKPLFDFELKSIMGQKANDVLKIIEFYRKEVITGIMAPQLILGQDGSGSFALSESLESVTAIVIDARLQEIKDQLNHDLVRQLFELNGWSTEVTPYFDFSTNDNVSLDDLGKFIQRVGAAGMLSNDAETANWIATRAGMPTPFDDVTVDVETVRSQMTNFTSNAGEGMVPGSTGNGTSKSSSQRDNSISNLENT